METVQTPAVRWRQVWAFVGLTFTLTWLLDLFIWLTGGYSGNKALGLLLQLQMLLPAASAIILQMFFFKDSRIYHSSYSGKQRWFFYFFLGYTVLYVLIGILVTVLPEPAVLASISAGIQAITLVALLFAIVIRLLGGKEDAKQAGLLWGHPKYWALFGVGIVALYLLSTLLNYLFGLGKSIDFAAFIAAQVSQATGSAQAQAQQMANIPTPLLFFITALQSVLIGPLIGLPIAFGEEYGWRGYLQGELVKMGRAKGVLLLGVIWGIWHAPIIAMGHNYPGHPLAGVFLMTGYCIGLAYILGYTMLKSRSVWLAAYLHALNNQIYSFLVMLVYQPNDSVFSFGAGLYGLAVLAVVVFLILRDPVWRQKPE